MNRAAIEPVTIQLSVGGVPHRAQLVRPPGASAIVLFVPGDGPCAASACYGDVARALHRAGIATLMVELLSADEEQLEELSGGPSADFELLVHRVAAMTDRLREHPVTTPLRIGYFGSGLGAAVALAAAAERPEGLAAIVSITGRLELAEAALPRVRTPTLLITGENAADVAAQRRAFHALRTEKFLSIVSELGQPPEPYEEAARETALWFSQHLIEAAEPTETERALLPLD